MGRFGGHRGAERVHFCFEEVLSAEFTAWRAVLRERGDAQWSSTGVSSFIVVFTLCVDVLLQELALVLRKDERITAFADDTAAVISDHTAMVPGLGRCFSMFQRISALALSIS